MGRDVLGVCVRVYNWRNDFTLGGASYSLARALIGPMKAADAAAAAAAEDQTSKFVRGARGSFSRSFLPRNDRASDLRALSFSLVSSYAINQYLYY